MRELLNQYSSLLVGVAAVLVALVVFRRAFRWMRRLALIGIIAALAIGLVVFRTGSGDIVSAADLDQAIAERPPVVVHFFSNY